MVITASEESPGTINSIMDFKALFDFLSTLRRHNSKAWMDANRNRYVGLRDDFKHWLQSLDLMLAEADPGYFPTDASKAINRINNNLKFHPDRPVYKDHFGAGLDRAPGTGDFYIQIGVGESLLAGGLWRPAPDKLQSIREAIDYNGDELQKILAKKSFRRAFGGLYSDEPLKTAPKGFPRDHRHIDLLRHKTFAVVHPLPKDVVLNSGFKEYVVQIYLEMLSFRRYLNHAISV